GKPYDLRVTALANCSIEAPSVTASDGQLIGATAAEPQPAAGHTGTVPHYRAAPGRAVLAAAPGPGIAELFAEAGAIPLACPSGRPPNSAQLSRAIADAGVEEIIILVNDPDGLAAASAAAEQVHRGSSGARVAVVPSKAVVQGIAAVAVHEPGRRFDADIVAMTAAAGATRHAALQVAVEDAWT